MNHKERLEEIENKYRIYALDSNDTDYLLSRVKVLTEALEKAKGAYMHLLETMKAININLGYQFTQPLMNASERFKQIEAVENGEVMK